MATQLAPEDHRLTWHGTVSLEHGDGWVMPWRIPHEQRALFPHVSAKAAMPAGVRLAFLSDTRLIRGRVQPDAELKPIDLCVDGELWGTCDLAEESQFSFDALPVGEKRLELWLPQFGQFRLRGLELSPNATVRPLSQHQRRWITYGSSITQCRAADSPCLTWPAIVARQCGLNLTCLGFGGECHLDAMVARMIRDLPAELISMCVGINCHGGSLSRRTFLPGILGFVEIVRERHADVPLVLVSPIFSPPREQTAGGCGMTLAEMRLEVEQAVRILRESGQQRLHYINGLDLLGPEEAAMLPDELHPDTAGYAHIAGRFVERLKGLNLV